jgi:putative ABC transport system permease protein
MIHAAFRDLLWRRRRYLISVVGCGLVFGLSLLMSGLSAAFSVELDQTMANLGAKSFVLPDGVGGPFSGSTSFPAAELPAGVVPMAYLNQTAHGLGDPVAISVIGVPRGSDAEPGVVSGRALHRRGEVLVDDRSKYATGSTMEIGGIPFDVVGRVSSLSLTGGVLGVVMDLHELQSTVFGGAPLATAGIVTGGAPAMTEGMHAVTTVDAREDGLRVLESAIQSISFITGLLWGVAALIIASVVYLSATERTRDFAVFKATGTATAAMGAGLAMQALVVAIAAALVGVLVGVLLAPTFPMPVAISWGSVGLLLVVALVVGSIASLFGLRRALSVEPALAFGGAA